MNKPDWLYLGAECVTKDGRKANITSHRQDKDVLYPFRDQLETSTILLGV